MCIAYCAIESKDSRARACTRAKKRNEGEKGDTDKQKGVGQVRLNRHATLDRPSVVVFVPAFVSLDLRASSYFRYSSSPFVSFYNRSDVAGKDFWPGLIALEMKYHPFSSCAISSHGKEVITENPCKCCRMNGSSSLRVNILVALTLRLGTIVI